MAALTFDTHGALRPLRAAGLDVARACAATAPIRAAGAPAFPIR